MTQKVRFGVMVALAVAAFACGADNAPITPASPSPTVAVAPPPNTGPVQTVPGELWRLTTTVVSLEGSACFWNLPVGATNDDWTLSVDRAGTQVRFLYDVNNPHDNLLFVGVVNERSFTAVSDTYRSSWRCAPNVSFASSVDGSFSSDGRTISGRERLTYRVDGGSELTITLEWNAARM